MYQICVSGAAKGKSVAAGAKLAAELGAAIARGGHSLMSGATTGLPDDTAAGYKKAGGKMSFGMSPASSKEEHVYKYRLPTKSYDVILYTGLHYAGRDALLIGSADAVVTIGGRLGTLHEFTIAAERHTPIGILEGAGGVTDQLQNLLKLLPNANQDYLVFDEDPDRLIQKLTKLLNEIHAPYKSLYT